MTRPLVVRRIFEYLDGATIRGIAAALTAVGIPAPTGKAERGATSVHLNPFDARKTTRTRRDGSEIFALSDTVSAPEIDADARCLPTVDRGPRWSRYNT